MKKNLIIFLLSLILLTACEKEEPEVVEDAVKYVTTIEIQERSFAEQVKLPGKIIASKETSVSSLSS
ncbi:MAG: hypothetical protein LBC61_03420 [Candidatus Peribacteria bacterium]|jgi:hypothetical protein|nr:hypothetical protein [Candidatus Peribacteria bacterium]